MATSSFLFIVCGTWNFYEYGNITMDIIIVEVFYSDWLNDSELDFSIIVGVFDISTPKKKINECGEKWVKEFNGKYFEATTWQVQK